MLELIIIVLIILFIYERNKSKPKANKDIKSEYVKEVSFEKRNYDSIVNKEINPYKKKQYLLTKAEKNFFDVLKLALEDTEYYICPKVRLADVIYVSTKNNYTAYFNKIKSKHIDYSLCDKNNMSPIIAIELDDKSHLDIDRIERDTFFNLSLTESGIIVHRFDVGYSYNINEIKEKLNITKLSS